MYQSTSRRKDSDECEFDKNYSQSKNKGLWMIGPEAGQFNGGLAHRLHFVDDNDDEDDENDDNHNKMITK